MSTTMRETLINELLQDENTYTDLPNAQLIEKAVLNKEGQLTDKGAFAVKTGKYTGRSPQDKFIVKDDVSEHTVDWMHNQPISESTFESLYNKVINYLRKQEERYALNAYVSQNPDSRLNLQVINEYAWHNLFVRNLFITDDSDSKGSADDTFTILSAPGFHADPETDGTNSETFIIISFKEKTVLIGGTEYAGEMKKSIFSVMNYLLPENGKLSMHCSANVSEEGKTALFFGLSGTGKTTLSNTENRQLIGDDEHGWSDEGVFNIEGGCYAKTITLSKEKEPQIYNAIQFGTVLENVVVDPGSSCADYDDNRLTENTRAAYGLERIPNLYQHHTAGHPSVIMFLTADAFGVLPPISKLTHEQAMYHFLSGYTSKLAGTERGITKPVATFSACFGAPFLPKKPVVYAEMLGEKIRQHDTEVYLVNTGWTGGTFQDGGRMPLKYTRAMVEAALDGKLADINWTSEAYFGLQVPEQCPEVPTDLLLPENAWDDKDAYRKQAEQLVQKFNDNFSRFEDIPDAILKAGPKQK